MTPEFPSIHFKKQVMPSDDARYGSIEGLISDEAWGNEQPVFISTNAKVMPVPRMQPALQLSADEARVLEQAKALYQQGLLNHTKQQFEAAKIYLEQALDLFKTLSQHSAEAIAGMALTHAETGWLLFNQEAVPHGNQSSAASGSRPKASRAFAEAEKLLQPLIHSQDWTHSLDIRVAQCRLEHYQGLMAFRLGEFGEALYHWKLAQAVLKSYAENQAESDSPRLQLEQAKFNDSMAIYHERLFQFDQAEALLLSAVEIKQSLNIPYEAASSLQILGRLYHRMGKIESASNTLEQALALSMTIGDHRRATQLRNDLIELFIDSGQINEVKERIADVLSTLNLKPSHLNAPLLSPVEATTLLHFARVTLYEKDFTQTYSLLQEWILPFWKRIEDDRGLGKSHRLLGQLQAETDQLQAAVENLLKAIECFELTYRKDSRIADDLLATHIQLATLQKKTADLFPERQTEFTAEALKTVLAGLKLVEQSGLDSYCQPLEDLLFDLDLSRWKTLIQKRITRQPLFNQERTLLDAISALSATQEEPATDVPQMLLQGSVKNEPSQEHRKTQSLLSLLRVGQAMAAERDLDKLLSLVKEETERALDADRCTLFLYDADRNELWSRVASGMDNTVGESGRSTASEIRFPAHMGIAGYVAKTGEIVNIPNAYEDSRFNPEVDRKTGYKTHNLLCMPMWNRKHQLLGVFQVLNKKDPDGHWETYFGQEDQDLLMAISANAGVALENAMLDADQKVAFDSFIKTLSSTIDARDPITAGHSERVADYSLLIGNEMHLTEEEQEALKYASLLHDIGKIGIKEEILVKDGRLTAKEYAHIQKHVSYTYDILKNIHFDKHLATVPEIAATHHEKMDGSGYFRGLRGVEIPLSGRIMAVSDVFDAITSRRHYRNRMPFDRVLGILQRDAGSHFDPDCISAFYNLRVVELAEVLIREKFILEKQWGVHSTSAQNATNPQVIEVTMKALRKLDTHLTIRELEPLLNKPELSQGERQMRDLFLSLYAPGSAA